MDRRAARRVSRRPSGSRSQVEPELALDAKGNFLALRAASFVPLTKGTEAEARGIGLGAYVELQSGAAGTRRGYGAPGRYRRDGHRHLVERPGPRDELCAALDEWLGMRPDCVRLVTGDTRPCGDRRRLAFGTLAAPRQPNCSPGLG